MSTQLERAQSRAQQASADLTSLVSEMAEVATEFAHFSDDFTIYKLPYFLRVIKRLKMAASDVSMAASESHDSLINLMLEQIEENGRQMQEQEHAQP